MTNKLKQIIQEELSRLPKENQDAINSFDWIKISEDIGQRYKLEAEEVDGLQAEITLVLLGIEATDLLAINIEQNIRISKSEAEKIGHEIVENIIVPISEIINENIKQNLDQRDTHPEQNIDFILSGGNYSAFLRKNEGYHEPEKADQVLGSSNIQTTKGRLLE